jgi:hypothetical protein
LPERARVACIDDRLLPDQGHNLIVEAPGEPAGFPLMLIPWRAGLGACAAS